MRKTQITPSLTSQLKIAARIREAFLRYGYEHMTMVTLASACGLTRRALYYYFSSKEEAFRAMIWLENSEAIQAGRLAAEKKLASRGNAADVIAAWLDARYGDTRRRLSVSAFAKEINDAAFVVCADVMDEFAVRTHDELGKLLRELEERKLLRLEKPHSVPKVARLLADGARGVNQTRPPIPNSTLGGRYREMSAAILHGTAKKTAR